ESDCFFHRADTQRHVDPTSSDAACAPKREDISLLNYDSHAMVNVRRFQKPSPEQLIDQINNLTGIDRTPSNRRFRSRRDPRKFPKLNESVAVQGDLVEGAAANLRTSVTSFVLPANVDVR